MNVNYHSQTFYTNQSVKQVDVPSLNGSFGILPNHVPILAVLKPGVITVHEDDGSLKKVLVSSGTVNIKNNVNNTIEFKLNTYYSKFKLF